MIHFALVLLGEHVLDQIHLQLCLLGLFPGLLELGLSLRGLNAPARQPVDVVRNKQLGLALNRFTS